MSRPVLPAICLMLVSSLTGATAGKIHEKRGRCQKTVFYSQGRTYSKPMPGVLYACQQRPGEFSCIPWMELLGPQNENFRKTAALDEIKKEYSL